MCFKIWCMWGWTLNYNLKSDSLIFWLWWGLDQRNPFCVFMLLWIMQYCDWPAGSGQRRRSDAWKSTYKQTALFAGMNRRRAHVSVLGEGQLIRLGFHCVPELTSGVVIAVLIISCLKQMYGRHLISFLSDYKVECGQNQICSQKCFNQES